MAAKKGRGSLGAGAARTAGKFASGSIPDPGHVKGNQMNTKVTTIKELLQMGVGDYARYSLELLSLWKKGDSHLRFQVKHCEPSTKYYSEEEVEKFWQRIPELQRQLQSIEARETAQ